MDHHRGGSGDGSEAVTSSALSAFRFSLALLLTVLTAALASQLPFVKQVWGDRSSHSVLWPQGWSYFDNAGEADVFVAYRIDADGKVIGMATQVQMAQKNSWGLGRLSKGQHLEMREIWHQVPPADWISCGNAADDCSAMSRGRLREVINRSQSPTLCGALLLERAQPLHWTSVWRSGQPTLRVKEATTVHVICEDRAK